MIQVINQVDIVTYTTITFIPMKIFNSNKVILKKILFSNKNDVKLILRNEFKKNSFYFCEHNIQTVTKESVLPLIHAL